ncbi:hypothetical protein HYDPIDRAFT_33165 [Hydnomerulius pinastri MD-312]|uniref:Lectin n=1 Tax=Hydnomerulius pinastri MD-312 TaxID=994086 RepID=A0A0C9W9E0_9AGAM|nr:hypothetical protein HYDPIDRAFT_33165 [Hydnomerulius pinastri MD-312]
MTGWNLYAVTSRMNEGAAASAALYNVLQVLPSKQYSTSNPQLHLHKTSNMSYTINCRVYQMNPARGFFDLVEKTVFNYANGGTWSMSNGAHLLTMGGSGTSGTLRFMSDKGERAIIAVGVHNNKRWCDVVTGLEASATGVLINPEYYNGKRDFAREKQLADYSVTSAAGTKYEVKYTVADGNHLQCNILIG